MRVERAKAIVFLLVGVGLIVAALVTGAGVRRFVAGSDVVRGRVSRLNAGGSHPEIEFTTRAGESVSFPQGGFIGGYAPGDQVEVRYDPADPRLTARLDSFGALWFAPMLLSVLGLGLGLAGFLNLPLSNRS